MVTEDDTRVIDPEFAFYGPIGFDLGAFLGNLLMDHHAQSGLASAASPRAALQQWLLEQMVVFWEHFRARFLELWRSEATGDAYPVSLFADAAGAAVLEAERQRFMDGLFADMVGFAAMKTVRRILGFAHNIDFDRIADPVRRAACERAALLLARDMLVEPERFASISAVVEAVRRTAPVLP
jgi:5-methylthioribose kinase